MVILSPVITRFQMGEFNLGVELGQASLLSVLLPLARFMNRSYRREQFSQIGAILISSMGAWWLVVRMRELF